MAVDLAIEGMQLQATIRVRHWRRLAALALTMMAMTGPVLGQAPGCQRVEFEAVVDAAAAALRSLNQANQPGFQEKLRRLKAKRVWSHDQFMREGVAFVRDDQIAEFDQKSEQLLNGISSKGDAGGHAKVPDCALLVELRAQMQLLIETQKAKWVYMHDKIGSELGR